MNRQKIFALCAALICGLLMVGGGVWAMSSGSYAIDWDVIGGGGEPASSTNYAIEGTIGQPAAESSFSTNYKLWSGYWYPAAPAGPPPEEPTIGFSPPSFSFSAIEGGADPADKTLEIWNSGAGTLDWSVSDDAGWLSLSPPGGSSTGEHDSVTVSVDISGKSAGNYPATITISAPGATNTPQTVPVTLQVSPSGVCQDEPSPEVAFANLIAEGKLVIAYNFDPFTTVPTAVNGWTWYDPELPPALNNLDQLYLFTAYWIKVTEDCSSTYGTWNPPTLKGGWNNPVWLGC